MAGDPQLRVKATLEAQVQTPDGGGGWTQNWTPLGVLPAAVQPSSGQEVMAGSRQAQRVTHRVTVRASGYGAAARPRADQRFRIGARILAIKAVFERDPQGRRLTCLCEEGEPT